MLLSQIVFEIEQVINDDNNCFFAVCDNFALVQAQIGAPAIANLGNILVDSDISNSVELEQEITQENTCLLAGCENIALVNHRRVLLPLPT